MKKFKAILSAGIALCIGASSLTTAFAADEVTLNYEKIGDYNSNKVVDVTDVTVLQMQLAGYDAVAESAMYMTDFNGDEVFDVNDVTESQKMLAGLEYTCYAEMDSSYLNIERSDMRARPTLPEQEIEFERVLFTNELVPIIDEYKYQYRKDYLINSKEQFAHLFGTISPDFDDSFFEEYSLYIWIIGSPSPSDRTISRMGVEDNKLLIDINKFNKFYN